MYPREPDQTYGATVNSWMRDNISAADAYAPAFTVSANDPSRFSSNKIFAQQTHPVGTASGLAPAFQTPMVSGSLATQFREATHPYSRQVGRSRRMSAARFPPSPAPTFVGNGNVFSEGETDQFADTRPVFADAIPLDNYGYRQPV